MKAHAEPIFGEVEPEEDRQSPLTDTSDPTDVPVHGQLSSPKKRLLDATRQSNFGSLDGIATVVEEPVVKPRNALQRFTGWLIPYGGLVSNCFSLGSVTLGAGIISMPSSFAMSGIVMSIIYLVVITTVTVYTMTLMGYAMEKTGAYTFEELARVLFGRGWDYFVGFVLWVSAFGSSVAYISAVSSLITPILHKAPGTPDYLLSTSGNRLITSLIWLVLMVPVVIPKHVNSIRYVSAFGVTMVLYFVVVLVVHSSTNGMKKGMRGDMQNFTTGNKAIYGLSIFIFAYMCQVVAGNIYSEQLYSKYYIRRHFHTHHPDAVEPLFPVVEGQVIRRPLDTFVAADDPTVTDPGRTPCPVCRVPIISSRMGVHFRSAHPGHDLPDFSIAPNRHRRRAFEVNVEYRCPYCPKVYTTANALLKHHRRKHGTLPRAAVPPAIPPAANPEPQPRPLVVPSIEAEVPATPAFAYRCQLCRHTNRTRNGLVDHVQHHHPQHNSGSFLDDGTLRSFKIPIKKLQCPICPNTFTGKATLTVHLARAHDIGELVKAAPWMRDHRCEETPEHLLECPGTAEIRLRHGVSRSSVAGNAFEPNLSRFLCELFGLPDPTLPDPDEAVAAAPPAPVPVARSASLPIVSVSSRLLIASASRSEQRNGERLSSERTHEDSERGLHVQEAEFPDEIGDPGGAPLLTHTRKRRRRWKCGRPQKVPRYSSTRSDRI